MSELFRLVLDLLADRRPYDAYVVLMWTTHQQALDD